MLPFETVREGLLRAGIAPRHAQRYVTELREHLADLTERERASGLDETRAAERAKSFVGEDAELAQAMIDRAPSRSLTARAPWAVFALSPVPLWMALIWVTDSRMIHVLLPLNSIAPSAMPQSYRALIGIVSFVVNYLAGVLLMAGYLVLALRQRLSTRWLWIGLALLALFSAILGFHWHEYPAEAGHPGGWGFSALAFVYLHGHRDLAVTLGVAALHAAVLFVAAIVVHRIWRLRLVLA
jgi:hypothetical protein